MNLTKTHKNFLKSIEFWEIELEKYDFNDLLKKPDDDSWSMGQVYVHLVSSTLNFHLKQLDVCLQSTENQSLKKNFKGFISYNVLGGFPPIKIKVPASDFYTPKQPATKKDILDGLNLVKEKMKTTLDLLLSSKAQGKTIHPGFSYLNANEWYQMVEMHFRHHLRQKGRIEAFLAS